MYVVCIYIYLYIYVWLHYSKATFGYVIVPRISYNLGLFFLSAQLWLFFQTMRSPSSPDPIYHYRVFPLQTYFAQNATQPKVNQSLGPSQANIFPEKYFHFFLQWLVALPSSWVIAWQDLSHKEFLWFLLVKTVIVQTCVENGFAFSN